MSKHVFAPPLCGDSGWLAGAAVDVVIVLSAVIVYALFRWFTNTGGWEGKSDDT